MQTNIDSALSILSRLTYTLDDACRDVLRRRYPKAIYHYTTARGLLGIIDSGEVYLTDARYLNDQSELIYGSDLALQVFSKVPKEKTNEETKKVLRLVEKSLSEFSNTSSFFRFYVACFCEDGNLLSQWRSYGNIGSGYALGFKPSSLSDATIKLNEILNLHLQRIEYRREKQIKVIETAINLSIQEMEKNLKSSFDITHWHALTLALIVGNLIYFKHPVFHEENEWRLTCHAVGDQTIPFLKFREVGRYIVPYLQANLAMIAKGKSRLLPLSSVSIAPSIDPELRKFTLRDLLRARGYSERKLKIIGSDIPLRIM